MDGIGAQEIAQGPNEVVLRRYPNEPRATPDVMFRLAELYYERSADDHQLARAAGNSDLVARAKLAGPVSLPDGLKHVRPDNRWGTQVQLAVECVKHDMAPCVTVGSGEFDSHDRNEYVSHRQKVERGMETVAAICHGGWIPISAGVYRGVHVTGSPGIKDDLVNAGAIWQDAAVVVDRHFVSSRKPDDLPDFCRAIIEVMTQRG